MLIKFLENAKYSEDGHTVLQGRKGEKRDVADTAAVDLMKRGKAYNAEPWEDETFTSFRTGDPLKQLEALNRLTLNQIEKHEPCEW